MPWWLIWALGIYFGGMLVTAAIISFTDGYRDTETDWENEACYALVLWPIVVAFAPIYCASVLPRWAGEKTREIVEQRKIAEGRGNLPIPHEEEPCPGKITEKSGRTRSVTRLWRRR